MSRIKTARKTAEISYEYLTGHLRTAYGPLIGVMESVEGSPEAVIAKIKRPGLPARLRVPLPVDDGEAA